jgi:hypothetical protein
MGTINDNSLATAITAIVGLEQKRTREGQDASTP